MRYLNYKFSMDKFAKGNNSTTKNNNTIFKISTGNLLFILYQLTKFEAPSCKNFCNRLVSDFQCPNLQREIARKKNNKKVSPFNPLIILVKPANCKFEAPSYNSFWDISFYPFKRGKTPQMEIIQTKKIQVSYFLMRNPFMKFQNPNFFIERTHAWTHSTSPKQYAFSKLGA